jgi:ubiquitin-protein ligase
MSNNHVVSARMAREIDEMKSSDSTDNFQMTMIDGNMLHWDVLLFGPTGTPYENGMFHIDVVIPGTYPFCPPNVRFVTRIFHCNVSETGSICMDILKDEWSPALTISKVIMSVSSLLAECNPDDPLSMDVALLYRQDRDQHDAVARQWTHMYANA